jgi:hypothetical protein
MERLGNLRRILGAGHWKIARSSQYAAPGMLKPPVRVVSKS